MQNYVHLFGVIELAVRAPRVHIKRDRINVYEWCIDGSFFFWKFNLASHEFGSGSSWNVMVQTVARCCGVGCPIYSVFSWPPS
jgi:hypothetical protein